MFLCEDQVKVNGREVEERLLCRELCCVLMSGALLIEFFSDELLVVSGQYWITEVFLFLIKVRCIKNKK